MTGDRWSEWLGGARDGGDAAVRSDRLGQLGAVRDHVLDGARLTSGDSVLDVGTGEGLMGFGALDRVAPDGMVTFSDISRALLDHCRAEAHTRGLLDRCRFVEAAADALTPIADASVDAVVTRSALMYASDKPRALREFARVLRPGGRVSLFEPVNRHLLPEPEGEFMGYRCDDVVDLAARLQHYRDERIAPTIDFDDGDLVRIAEAAGLVDIEVNLIRRVRTEQTALDWRAFMASSANPLLPTWGEIAAATLSGAELERFAAVMRPRVDAGVVCARSALATVTARLP